ncbi:MAG: hypothetical protein P1U87_16675 [Verrucomicrobiales bacterium]|nr:hypothetical protein [Verrucomicrobiales bacterium]
MRFSRSNHSNQKAFTLVELSLAIALTIGIASALLGLLQQQVTFTETMRNFSFLRDEAPQVNTLLTNIVNRADNYRIFPDIGSAKNLSGAVRTGGKTIRLRFRNPDGTSDHAIVAFETVSGQKQLNYYFRSYSADAWPTNPTWTISTKPDVVTFDNSTGVLLITLTGSKGEEIAYAGNPD